MLSSRHQRIALALLALAVALGLLGAATLAVLGPRRREARRRTALETAQAALARLEYVPPVTTGTRRIRWRGDRSRVKHAPAPATDLVGHDAGPARRSERTADAVATKTGPPKVG
jgi:hypothetical protein